MEIKVAAGRLLFGALQHALFAAEEFLGERRQLGMLQLSLFKELHLRFHRFTAAPLALLCNVTLIMSHSNPSFVDFPRMSSKIGAFDCN
jgi:hypothetical protein